MNLLKIAASSLLLLGVAAAPVFAGDHDRDRDRGHHGQHHGYSQGHRNDGGRNYRNQDRRDYHTGYSQGYRQGYQSARPRVVYRQPQRIYVQPRPVYVHQPAPWRRGGHYYGQGYGPTYVVNDYDYYGLNRPPRGYGWRRSDTGNFLLVALATGIIADIILNH
ncbi:MAG: RcnB family protein [Pseudoxanthomonas sp.]